MKYSRKFNPFNLENSELDTNSRIKFRKSDRRIKTRPLWWLIALFIVLIIVFLYLGDQL